MLAAGLGSRFGDAPKMLAEAGGQALVRRAVTALLGGGLPVLVVTGHRADDVAACLASLPVRVVANPDYRTGLASSLQAGFAALPPDAEAALVALGDMPGIGADLVRELTHAWRDAGRPTALVPVHGDRRGNPVVLSRALAPEIAALTGDRGAGPLLRARDGVVEFAVADAAVLVDVDTPEALRAFAADRTAPADDAALGRGPATCISG